MKKNTNANAKMYTTAYALCETIVPYYRECRFASPILEERLRLYWCTAKDAEQRSLIGQATRRTERVLASCEGMLGELRCVLHLVRVKAGICLVFETGLETVYALVRRNGTYRITVKIPLR